MAYKTKGELDYEKLMEIREEYGDTFLLEKYIGLSKDDLINFFLIQKDRYTPFLLLSDTKKKEILSKFTGIKKYSFIEEKIT